MLSSLVRSGFEITEDKDSANTVVINTCAFLRSAKEESLETILEMSRLKKEGALRSLVVAGCLVQLYGDDLRSELPEVDVFIGAADMPRIGEVLGGAPPDKRRAPERVLLSPPGSAYLKISEGCSNRCSYCLIPTIKGPYRSRPVSSLIKEAKVLVEMGVKEIIIVSQDTTAYGLDLGDGSSLETLLRKLVRIDGLRWVRLLYCNPHLFTDSLISLIRDEKKICPYLDIPIQHVSNRILKAMNRRTEFREVKALFEKLRENIPGLCLRSTAIVGFPGETEEEFSKLLSFVKEAEIEWFGAFPYSPEEGTPAAALPDQLPRKLREERWDAFMGLQSSISQAKNESHVGKELIVLVAGEENGRAYGRTYFQAPEVDGRTYLEIPGGRPPAPGVFVKVRVVDGLTYDLIAEPVSLNTI